MQKKIFGIALPAFVIAAVFMFGMSIARVQQVRAATAPASDSNLSSVNTTAAASGGVSCTYCRNMYIATGDYYAYMYCLYSPPCVN